MTTTRDQALEIANYVRTHQAELKRQIRAGEVKAQDVLRGELEGWMEGMRIGHLLRSVPRIGSKYSLRMLAQVSVHESRQLRFLTRRQRHEIARLLDEREAGIAKRRSYGSAA